MNKCDVEKLGAAKAYEIEIEKVNHKLEFAQLCKMLNALSFGLSNAGFICHLDLLKWL